MSDKESDAIIRKFQEFVHDDTYPCVAARAALARNQTPCLVVGHMACPKDDFRILDFIYGFVKDYRLATRSLYSAVIIFEQPQNLTEEFFEALLWERLQSLSQLDAQRYGYDQRVNADPSASDFSFSLAAEAFFVIGLHPASERRSRRFAYPALVFNPHDQFERMRADNRYEKMKQIVRKRDISYSGSINPMLSDFGEASEVYQYSGRRHDQEWTCPLKITHARPDDRRTPE